MSHKELPVVCMRCGMQWRVCDTDDMVDKQRGYVEVEHESWEDCFALLKIESKGLMEQGQRAIRGALEMRDRAQRIWKEANGVLETPPTDGGDAADGPHGDSDAGASDRH